MSVLAAATAAGNAELVGFIVLAPLAVLAALGVVLNRNAIYAALLLVVNLFCLAVFYLFLQAQFLAAVQVIVYAGAIMILFLFVLMLLGVRRDDREFMDFARRGGDRIRIQWTIAFALGAALLAGVAAAVTGAVVPNDPAGITQANQGGNVEALGRLLFTRYTLAFEATGVLLLVAGVGALVLARRTGGGDEREEQARQPSLPRQDPGDAGEATEEREPVPAAVPASGAAASAAEPSANGHQQLHPGDTAAGPTPDASDRRSA